MSLQFPQDLKLNVQNNARLEDYTTFRLGGPCRALITCETPQQLESAVKHLVKEQFPFILIGGGSNLVVADEGLDCFVVRFVSAQPIIRRVLRDCTSRVLFH